MRVLSLLASTATAAALAVPAASSEKQLACPAANETILYHAMAAFSQSRTEPASFVGWSPTVQLDVDYKGKSVYFGNPFAIMETLREPSFYITAEKGYDPKTTNYTLIMVDPDAPGPAHAILKHDLIWVVSDVQPRCISDEGRKIVVPYNRPRPLSVDPHRYVFFVYRQPANYVPPYRPVLEDPMRRTRFNLSEYTSQANLQGPVGGNFYREGTPKKDCSPVDQCTPHGHLYEDYVHEFRHRFTAEDEWERTNLRNDHDD